MPIGQTFSLDALHTQTATLQAIQTAGNHCLIAVKQNQPTLYRPDFGALPLFAQVAAADDLATGYIYVLRSKSEHPFIAENRSVIHKIGVIDRFQYDPNTASLIC